MKPKTNYCTFSPDGIPFTKYYWGDCCKRHDEIYKHGEPKPMTREECDLKFLEELKTRMPFLWMAKLYYFAVRKLSGPSWHRWDYTWYIGFIPIRKK